MAKVLIFRNRPTKAHKLSKAAMTEAVETVNRRSKVQRPNLMDFFIKGDFDKLPVVDPKIIKNPFERWRTNVEKTSAYEVTDLGRDGEATKSQANSIRIWIEMHIKAMGFDTDAVSVVYVED